MQILASALPGFRELRAPLTAGYLWVLFLWIVIKPDVTKQPTNEVAAAVYDLGKHAGPIWIALAVGVAAYLMGSVSLFVSAILGLRALTTLFAGADRDLVDEYAKKARSRLSRNPRMPGGDIIAYPDREVDCRVSAARTALERAIQRPPILQAARVSSRGQEPQQLFSDADRLSAERELRLAVVPPLLASAILLTCTQSCWWALAVIPIFVLFWDAHMKTKKFRSLMIGAIELSVMPGGDFDQFRQWVDGIPDAPIPEQEAGEDGPGKDGGAGS